MGKDAEAEQEYRQVLPIAERALGAEHPDTLTTCHSLARCLSAQDKTAEALPYAKRALEGRLKVLGKDDTLTKSSQRLVDDLMQKDAKV